jgi:hypothetical protein
MSLGRMTMTGWRLRLLTAVATVVGLLALALAAGAAWISGLP